MFYNNILYPNLLPESADAMRDYHVRKNYTKNFCQKNFVRRNLYFDTWYVNSIR